MLTVEQKTIVDNIINEILRFRSTGVPFLIRVGGYAGTGKTFMLANLRREVAKHWGHLEIAFATFTGKASSVLKGKLLENNGIFGQDYIGTIHGLIYHPRTVYSPHLKKWIIDILP